MIGLTMDVNFVAILVAALANMILGMIWYSPSAFGTMWMELAGLKPKNKKEEQAMKEGMVPAMAGGFVISLVMAYVLFQLTNLLGLATAVEGAQLGFWIWLGFVGSVTLSNHMYSMKPIQLWYLNTGYRLISFLVMGAIVAVM